MCYYGNLNVYFLERMGTHAVTLSVLITQRHRFTLMHNILFFDQKYFFTHIKSTYFLKIPRIRANVHVVYLMPCYCDYAIAVIISARLDCAT